MCRASGVQKHVLFFCDFLTKTEQEVTEHPLLMLDAPRSPETSIDSSLSFLINFE
jgi:hypothetical protein